MTESYKVTVEGIGSFDLDAADADQLDLIPVPGGNDHILNDSRPHHARLLSGDFSGKRYRVRIDNTTYSIQISDPLDRQIEAMGFQLQSSRNISKIEAPMPGLILSVDVEEGQEVEEGDTLLVLEAMKMENAILAPQSGKIKSIAVEKGMAVEKKSLLVEFE